MNVALLVSYDGTDFSGWQIQDRDRTVQGALESAIAQQFAPARVTGSGRTDAGVHAEGQVCNFALDDGFRIGVERIADALNALLPPDVRVLESARVPDEFDACRTAKKKTYRYSLYFSRREHPLLERYAVRAPQAPDLRRCAACAKLLEGEHDFASFSATGSSVKTTVRRICSLKVLPREREGVPAMDIEVTGNGFLYNMVRILAGAVLAFGLGTLDEENILAALAGGGRRELLPRTLPAKGLTLCGVDYGFALFSRESR